MTQRNAFRKNLVKKMQNVISDVVKNKKNTIKESHTNNAKTRKKHLQTYWKPNKDLLGFLLSYKTRKKKRYSGDQVLKQAQTRDFRVFCLSQSR